MFIVLVDQYRGGNLRMDDIEFLPDDELARVRREAREDMASGYAKSALHRDVVVMTAIWAYWTSGGTEVDEGSRDTVLMDWWQLPSPMRRRLRFARVKEGACHGQPS